MAGSAVVSGSAIARVVPFLRVYSLGDRRFDYAIPAALQGRVDVGTVVGVPFGARNVRGVVVGVVDDVEGDSSALKPIDSVEERSICPELMSLADHLSGSYIAPLESCLRLVAPPVPGRPGTSRRSLGEDWIYKTAMADEDAVVGAIRLTAKQMALLATIGPEGAPRKAACEAAGVGRSVLTALVQKGLVRSGGSPPQGETRTEEGGEWPPLSDEQEQALKKLLVDLQSGELTNRQLWGVTGSGKTEVYLHLVRRALEDGSGVILLVPEIGLTPQMIKRVTERFGELVGVLHSGLTSAQRRSEYARIADGAARVVVGARSAIFAPVRDLGLVIIDESHDTSYKQEEAPGYHARTVALARLQESGGLLVEGSASPAVEMMDDPGACVRMVARAKGELPTCEVVDMRHRAGSGVLAATTKEALVENIRRGEQSIMLLNRRGYSGYVHCESCGHVVMCDECELSLTYHNRPNRLVCHHCGRSYLQPALCPECQEAPLVRGGPGTERLTEELSRIVRAENLFRLDSDVLTSGSRAQAILDEFSDSHPGVLVGTQMVAKGHDFPDVTLVVVADADMGLYAPDFRAAERTFQLLTQVSGRAGRSNSPGRVIVQTWNPDVPCIRMALDREDEAFYLRETAVRRRLGFPPYTNLIRLVLAGERAPVVQKAALHLAERLGGHFSNSEVRGPARLVTLRGRTRWHIVLSTKDGDRTRSIVAQAVAQLSDPYRKRGVRLLVEVDPYSFV